MDTKCLHIKQGGERLSREEEAGLRQAAEIIRGGGLVAFPTETVYGLGGDALNPESSRKIYAAKGRPSDNPLIIHICRFEDIRKIVRQLPEAAVKIAEAFWPGPLTMILPKALIVPRETTGGLDTVAVRFPSHPVAQKLIAYSGGYIAAPSANLSGKPSPTSAKYVIEDMDGRIDMIIDDGEVGIGLESTILDLASDMPRILRPGYITQEMLDKLLGKVDIDVTIVEPDSGQAPRAPGMKYRHYAPKGELVIVEGEPQEVVRYINEQTALHESDGKRTGIIGTQEMMTQYHASSVKDAGSRGDPKTIARCLYTFLREFDDEDIAYIYAESFGGICEDQGFGQAVMNRLLKAAGHRVIHV